MSVSGTEGAVVGFVRDQPESRRFLRLRCVYRLCVAGLCQ